jgi:hypothetical protein
MDDLTKLWAAYCDPDNEDDYAEDLGTFHEYGLSFDYVAPNTFDDQPEGYFRYQLSWGGPSDEFNFYVSGPDFSLYRTEYWFKDWFDGASITLTGEYLNLMTEIFEWFRDCGIVESEYNKE